MHVSFGPQPAANGRRGPAALMIRRGITLRRCRLGNGLLGQTHHAERLAETFLFTFYPKVQNDRDGLVQVILKGE